jgi:hypothetical protein
MSWRMCGRSQLKTRKAQLNGGRSRLVLDSSRPRRLQLVKQLLNVGYEAAHYVED